GQRCRQRRTHSQSPSLGVQPPSASLTKARDGAARAHLENMHGRDGLRAYNAGAAMRNLVIKLHIYAGLLTFTQLTLYGIAGLVATAQRGAERPKVAHTIRYVPFA